MRLSSETLLADIAFLSSDKTITGFNNSTDEINVQLKQLPSFIADYQPYIQRTMRNEDLDYLALAHGYEKAQSIDAVLSQLATQFLEWQGNCFEVKPNKLEQWLELLSLIDGSWVIAQAYANLFTVYDISHQDIITAIIDNQCPHALAADRTTKKYADNHVHLGGHGHTGPSLISFALYGATISTATWPKRPEYSLFESGLLDKALLPKVSHLLGDTLVNLAFDNSDASTQSACNAVNLVDSIFNSKAPMGASDVDIALNTTEGSGNFQLKTQVAHTPSQHAFLAAHCKPTRSDSKWLLFCLGTLWLKKNNVEQKIVAKFVRISNVLRNYMIVWGTGLAQFVNFSRFSARKSRNHAQQSNSRLDSLQADIDLHIFREFRITPGLLFNKNGNITGTALKKALQAAYHHALSENIHFVIHFSRSLTDKQRKQDYYQNALRTALKKQVEALHTFKSSITFADMAIAENGVEASLDLRKAIRGYDVAGNENDLPIEVFAPALRVLRSSKQASTNLFSVRFQRPFLTVHAGEDYSHLLSGMRAIDEAVVFCDFQQGDRLGHALALGINPHQWATRQHTAYVSLGEHLDNLVWCYQKALMVIQKVPELAGVLPLLLDKIHFWQGHLYSGEFSSATPRDCYDAWLLRRNCPSTYQLENKKGNVPQIDNIDPVLADWVIDFDVNVGSKPSSTAYNLWQRYVNVENRNDGYIKNRHKPVVVSCCPKFDDRPLRAEQGRFYDSVSQLELDLYEAIQDMQMERYASQGIVIEACPTSNIYIGRFEQYFEHPIFRWDPPEQDWLKQGGKYNRFGLRNGAILVCVNTDDAAIMPTTIANEHRVLQKAAVEHYEVGVNKAEDWIERIRKRGIEIFKSNHLNWIN